MPARAKPKSPLQGVDWPSEPFYKIVVPYLPPGINHSYDIRKIKTKLGKWAHTLMDSKESREFKENVAEYLEWGHGIVTEDWSMIRLISTMNAGMHKVPLVADIKFYFPTLWKRDLDGCEKHIIDAASKFLKLGNCPINDNTIVKKCTEKFVDVSNPRCEISLSVCLERINQC
jgi:hypothetical protein